MNARVKMFALVFCTYLLFTSPSLAGGSFINGGQYLQMTEEKRIIYVMGLHDNWSYFTDVIFNLLGAESQTHINRIKRCLKTMNSAGKVSQLIDSYVRESQVRSTYSMGSNFETALAEKCPR